MSCSLVLVVKVYPVKFHHTVCRSFYMKSLLTALMQACQYGHWEVVQILMLFKANIHRTDYLNGGTALHFAALNGHTRCIRLLLADHVPSLPDFWNATRRSTRAAALSDFDEDGLSKIVNKRVDGGITALHMAALNGHAESVQLLLDLGACVTDVTVEDGTTIDLIGAGSTALHYAACGGNAVCCQVLISRGASLTAQTANGWTPLMVARSWHRNWLEGILGRQPEGRIQILPSPYISLPMMSIMRIAREFGWRNASQSTACIDPCAVCLERRCTVSSEGCGHEFCTRCALYLCSTNIGVTASGPPGSIPCPLCRNAIVSFARIPGRSPAREHPRTSLSLSLCATCPAIGSEPRDASMNNQLCQPDFHCTRIPPLASTSFRSLSCQRFPSMKFNSTLCMGAPETSSCLIKCSRSGLPRSASQGESSSRRSWFFSFNQLYVTTGASS